MAHSFFIRVLASAVLLASIASTGFAQDCHVSTTLRFLNDNNEPVMSVTADQLRVKIGGDSAKVLSLAQGAKPALVLLIDNSGSVKGTWNESISAAKQLATAARDDVAAVVFRDRILASTIGLPETSKLLDQLPAVTPQMGGTLLYDTLIEVAGRLKGRNAAIVMIGDGGDNSSRHTANETARLFVHSSWPAVFGLILDYDHSDASRGDFKVIVDASGGTKVIPSSASEVAEVTSKLSAAALAPFVVTVQPSRPISKPAKLKVEVVGPDNKPLPHVKVLHVSEVEGCDSTQLPRAK